MTKGDVGTGDPPSLNENRIDETVLALLYLGLHDKYRAWKSVDWETLDRLHAQGWIDTPRGKAKSVAFTPDGLRRSQELFDAMFRGTD